jgi:hypothetical protein
MVNLLLKNGANRNIKDESGMSALDFGMLTHSLLLTLFKRYFSCYIFQCSFYEKKT